MKSFETVVAGVIAAAGLVATPALMLAAPVFAAPTQAQSSTSQAVQHMSPSTQFEVIGGNTSNTVRRHDFDFQR